MEIFLTHEACRGIPAPPGEEISAMNCCYLPSRKKNIEEPVKILSLIQGTLSRGEQMSGKAEVIMTIDELAAYLKIPKSTLYKLVREGAMPSQKIGRHWRFRKAAIDRWLRDREDTL